jgi:hypothetical protein
MGLLSDQGLVAPKTELLHGSGPKPGFLEVSDRVKSTKAVQNFRGKTPVDFLYDPEAGQFVMGRNPLGHEGIPLGGMGGKPGRPLVGGRIRFENGKLITDEWSGHYGQNWTPKYRANFVDFMKQRGIDINHTPWSP